MSIPHISLQKSATSQTGKQPGIAKRVFCFYRDGFCQMTLGRTLWKIIALKLLIMFGVLKLFFFPDFLATQFHTDEQRADHVIRQLTESGPPLAHSVGGE